LLHVELLRVIGIEPPSKEQGLSAVRLVEPPFEYLDRLREKKSRQQELHVLMNRDFGNLWTDFANA
jgi:hypothetical protein